MTNPNEITSLLDLTDAVGVTETALDRRARQLRDLIAVSPHIVIGFTVDGDTILDMSRTDVHPGDWGNLLFRVGTKAPKTWIVPANVTGVTP